MNQLELKFTSAGSPSVSTRKRTAREPPKEYKVVALRECLSSETLQLCDAPDKAAEYWRTHVTEHPYYTPEQEFFVVVFLNTRRKVKGHSVVGIGTVDGVLVSPMTVFRAAIIVGAPAILLMHSHPSGDPTPSDSDIKVTRDLIRAGQLIKIEIIDHVVMGRSSQEQPKGYASLRELGYFYP